MKRQVVTVLLVAVSTGSSVGGRADEPETCSEFRTHLESPIVNLRDEVDETLPAPEILVVENVTIERRDSPGCGGEQDLCAGKTYGRIVLGPLPSGVVVSALGGRGSSPVLNCNRLRTRRGAVPLSDGSWEIRFAGGFVNAGPACFQGIAADGRRTPQVNVHIGQLLERGEQGGP